MKSTKTLTALVYEKMRFNIIIVIMKSTKTLTTLVYEKMRFDIIKGIHKPNSKLRIEHLKTYYEVGATPIREGLSRMIAEGFVITEGQRGFTVSDTSPADLEDVTELRIILERKALESSITLGDEKWEAKVVASFYQLEKLEKTKNEVDIVSYEKRNQDFHLALISACRSRWLHHFYKILYDQHRRYRNIARTASTRGERDIHDEHHQIYEAALNRDIKTACEKVEHHMLTTAKIVLDYLEK